MNNAIIDKHINEIQGLIITGIPLVEAASSHFEEVSDIDLQKAILRELAGIYQDHAEELKKLYPWNPEFFTRDIVEFENYFKTYKPESGYICNVFATSNFDDGKLIFDRGTMNFIGARTSRGKTTAMVSMTVDALLNDKKVVFATFEETDRQIITRIVLNLAYRLILDEYNDNEANFRSRVNLTPFSPAKIFQSLIRNGWEKADYNPFKSNIEDQDASDLKELSSKLKRAYADVQGILREGRLMIFNGYLADFQNYLDTLANIERGSIVFADYIQKIPTPMMGGNVNRYAGIKQMLSDLYAVVKKRDLISINGAQFGRTDNKTNSKIKDGFTDESFQESSDIEQIGEIEIGIGRDPGFTASEEKGKGKNKGAILPEQSGNNKPKPRMFFSVLKNRNGENDPSLEFDLVDGRKFSYYATKKPIEPHY